MKHLKLSGQSKVLLLSIFTIAVLSACGGGSSSESSGGAITAQSSRSLTMLDSPIPTAQLKLGGAAQAGKLEQEVAGFIVQYKNQHTSSGAILAQASSGASISEAGLTKIATVASANGIALTVANKSFTGGRLLQAGAPIGLAKALEIAAQIKAGDSDIISVEPNRIMRASYVPNDTYYAGEQWHYQAGVGGLNLPAAWDSAPTRGQGVNVAVLDTGYLPHPDLAANIVGGYDFISDAVRARDGNGRDANATDEGDWNSTATSTCKVDDSSWHGTHVAGTVAAVTNNATGVAGVAFNAKVVPVRVLGKCGGTDLDIAEAIVWAAGGTVAGVPTNPNPAKVINLSLSGEGACGSVHQSAINQAIAKGATVVVAAGNEKDLASRYAPGNCSGVVTVAATGKTGLDTLYSNYGSAVTLSAPGGESNANSSYHGAAAVGYVGSTWYTGTTGPSSGTYGYIGSVGTSMAAPHIAGIAALLLGKKPSLTPAEVKSALTGSAKAYPAGCSPVYCSGAGMADPSAALTRIDSNRAPVMSAVAAKSVTEGATLSFTVSGSDPDGNALSYAIANAPAGSTFNSATGAFQWVNANPVGSYPISFTATDTQGASSPAASTTVTVVAQTTSSGGGGGGGCTIGTGQGGDASLPLLASLAMLILALKQRRRGVGTKAD